jgi:hypothetical protein
MGAEDVPATGADFAGTGLAVTEVSGPEVPLNGETLIGEEVLTAGEEVARKGTGLTGPEVKGTEDLLDGAEDVSLSEGTGAAVAPGTGAVVGGQNHLRHNHIHS